MITEKAVQKRVNRLVAMSAELVVAGGGMAGCCAAITAARQGIKVILVQDRPVLGGNASSEIRLWILGATSHMGNNNRWSREGGVIDEILLENLYRNKEGNTLILDTILLEKVTLEPNITLLLNTAVYELNKNDERNIDHVKAFCSQNSTDYKLSATLFCDATGDGSIGFLSGASFRIGAESKTEFNENLAPDEAYGELLGHSIYFYSKRTNHPVKFVPPAFALKNINELPKYKILNPEDHGCRLWWIEYGGRKDTVYETEEIKWELWKIVYGIWDYIKNSGQFEDVANLTLEWVGTIPGKRESRRFEGLYMLSQTDVVEQKHFEDAVAFGGWALDLHPADGVYSELPSCNQYHSKGIYTIPYRCYVSKDIDNLFFAGRIISATHVAFSSSRVMATCAHGAQAVGMAAALCIKHKVNPAGIMNPFLITVLQQQLNRTGQGLPGIAIKHQSSIDIPTIYATSTLELSEISADGDWNMLSESAAQLLPLTAVYYQFSLPVLALQDTILRAELRYSRKADNYTPDETLELIEIPMMKGEQQIQLNFTKQFPRTQYGFLIFHKNDRVAVKTSRQLFTGITALFNGKNKAVSNNGKQEAPNDSGVESFEFWIPKRRPERQNIAMKIQPALKVYQAENILSGFTRPYIQTNAWCADHRDKSPALTFRWGKPQLISALTIFFDTDYDHALESSLFDHPESVIPFCVRNYALYDGTGNILFEKTGNYQTVNQIKLIQPIMTDMLILKVNHPSEYVSAAIYHIDIV
ncbi:FAD-dependent oxidoreductase [Mucilaginibacter sabulilitoris]|uniref:FAD-dependent oxidoreductase n=1 Tax=Mucilaginibacter sabulilitoris TaxID=1173583 RepID=A0ABZ0TRK9_9SPHI|nr:FAD-dependent oxidoreductase [Mucilaginibacter sabulilitoris]WPU95547.1 FAD-dependent oxidoreductase [Mucilaginibacter sabulilitoris]